MRRLVATLALAVTLAGCSSGDKGGDKGGADYDSPKSIAAALDKGGFACTGYKDNPMAVGPKASGDCDHAGSSITISTFNSSEELKRLLSAFGASSADTAVQGDKWLVSTGSADEAQQASKVIGGKVG